MLAERTFNACPNQRNYGIIADRVRPATKFNPDCLTAFKEIVVSFRS